jgi:glutamate-1-semialdehyde 2,1-aminomutase
VIAGLDEAFEAAGITHTINRAGSLFSLFFTEGPVGTSKVHGARTTPGTRASSTRCSTGGCASRPRLRGWFLATAFGDAELERVVQAAWGAAQEVARVSG